MLSLMEISYRKLATEFMDTLVGVLKLNAELFFPATRRWRMYREKPCYPYYAFYIHIDLEDEEYYIHYDPELSQDTFTISDSKGVWVEECKEAKSFLTGLLSEHVRN